MIAKLWDDFVGHLCVILLWAIDIVVGDREDEYRP